MPNDQQTDPPQQLASAESHPWFHPYWSARVRVLVNGIERRMVTVADGPGRWVEMYACDGSGWLERGSDGSARIVRLEGDVVIVPKPAPND